MFYKIKDLITDGQIKFKLQLLVTEIFENGNASGVVQGEIRIIPDISERKLILTDVTPLGFTYIPNGVHITGTMVEQFGTEYEYNYVGNIVEFKNDKAKTQSTITLTGIVDPLMDIAWR